jgi:2-dehydro-3-deoxyphosphogluconate aldolase / (4S)-4-hydroxy-2-oxoglutarate aldolase
VNQSILEMLSDVNIIPVITLSDVSEAIPLAKALIAGGMPVLEITLRTSAGLHSIKRIKDEVEGAIVGAGTVLNERDLDLALEAGSDFIISPGITQNLLKVGVASGIPFMPGISDSSGLMECLEYGLTALKFFPAEAAGGVKMLKSFAGPFPDMRFCPTGGISLTNLADYMALPEVICVGGTWIAPSKLIQAGEWQAIEDLAIQANKIAYQVRSSTSQG